MFKPKVVIFRGYLLILYCEPGEKAFSSRPHFFPLHRIFQF